MPREYVKELRGDKRSEAIDIYHHIDRQELRRAYLAYISKLGVYLSSEAVEVSEHTTGRSLARFSAKSPEGNQDNKS